MRISALFCLVTLFMSCGNNSETSVSNIETENKIEPGAWKFSFLTQKHEIPIRAKFTKDKFYLQNASEEVELDYEIDGDSVFISIPNFDSHLEALIQSPTLIKGVYVKDYVEDYSIQFIAERSDDNVFGMHTTSTSELRSKYKTEFDYGDSKSPSIALFEIKNNGVVGSFANETGDYRFLEGVIQNSTLKLSTFDGTHLYLFTAEIKGDSLINGKFISGKGGSYSWKAVFDNEYELRNPEILTYLKEGYSTFDFKALDLSKIPVELNDTIFNSKVKIIQILGTWCPNCLDETRYFSQLYKKYSDKGLMIIGLAFENGSDTLKILNNLNRYKRNNDITYPVFYAGRSGSANASKAFPMLNRVMSFPTAIYLNEKNEVLKIYTGFYGPGTGEYYSNYTKQTEAYLDSLLN